MVVTLNSFEIKLPDPFYSLQGTGENYEALHFIAMRCMQTTLRWFIFQDNVVCTNPSCPPFHHAKPGPNFMKLRNGQNIIAQPFSVEQKLGRIPVTNRSCDIVFWLVTLIWLG